jgi:hypothetical protein
MWSFAPGAGFVDHGPDQFKAPLATLVTAGLAQELRAPRPLDTVYVAVMIVRPLCQCGCKAVQTPAKRFRYSGAFPGSNYESGAPAFLSATLLRGARARGEAPHITIALVIGFVTRESQASLLGFLPRRPARPPQHIYF